MGDDSARPAGMATTTDSESNLRDVTRSEPGVNTAVVIINDVLYFFFLLPFFFSQSLAAPASYYFYKTRRRPTSQRPRPLSVVTSPLQPSSPTSLRLVSSRLPALPALPGHTSVSPLHSRASVPACGAGFFKQRHRRHYHWPSTRHANWWALGQTFRAAVDGRWEPSQPDFGGPAYY